MKVRFILFDHNKTINSQNLFDLRRANETKFYMKKFLYVILICFAVTLVYNACSNESFRDYEFIHLKQNNEETEYKRIFGSSENNLFLGNELVPIEKDAHGSVKKQLQKVLLKDSLDNVYFFIQEENSEKIIYRINSDFKFEKTNLTSIDTLTSLYYTKLHFGEMDFLHQNGFTNTNPKSPRPKVKMISEEPYSKYFKRNKDKIICFSLNESDCIPSPRKAEFAIDIPLKNHIIKIRSEGTVDWCDTDIYYLNNLESDNYIFLVEGNKNLWMARIKN